MEVPYAFVAYAGRSHRDSIRKRYRSHTEI